MHAILLVTLYRFQTRAFIILVECLYSVYLVLVTHHFEYKIWIALHQALAIAAICVLLFAGGTVAPVVIVVVDAAVFLGFTWHYDPANSEGRSLKIIDVDKEAATPSE